MMAFATELCRGQELWGRDLHLVTVFLFHDFEDQQSKP